MRYRALSWSGGCDFLLLVKKVRNALQPRYESFYSRLLTTQITAMNDEQENAINMGQAVQEVFTTYATFVATIPALASSASALGSLMSNIELQAPNTGRKPTGFAGPKVEKRALLAESGAAIAAGVRAFAKAAGHPEILPDVQWKISDLIKGREQTCAARCLSILTHAQTHAAPLAATFGVTAADISTLSVRLEAFTGVAPKTKLVRAQRKTKTMEFDTMVTGMKTLLEECDDVVEAQRIKNPPFFNDYRNARRIDDFGGGGGKKKPPGPTPPPAPPA